MSILKSLPVEMQQIIAIYTGDVPMPYKIAEWVEDDILEKMNEVRICYGDKRRIRLLQNRRHATDVIYKEYGRFYRCATHDKFTTFLVIQNSETSEIQENQFVVDPDDVNWHKLSSDPKATAYLLKFPANILWTEFCRNTSSAAIQFISENLHNANWKNLSANPAAIGILLANKRKINWSQLCRNTSPDAIHLISENMYRIIIWYDSYDWFYLSSNPAAVDILAANLDKVDWKGMSLNTAPAAINILKTNLSKVDWNLASRNESTAPELFELFELSLETLNWYLVSINKYAIKFLEAHLDKVNFSGLSSNEAAIHILKNNMDKLDYHHLVENPALFEKDLPLYHKIIRRMNS